MQRKNNIVLRLHRQRKPEQVLLPLVREENGEALRIILEKQDNVTAEFTQRTEKRVRSGWLKLEIEQDGCRRSDNLEEELPVILEVETDIRPEAMTAMYLLNPGKARKREYAYFRNERLQGRNQQTGRACLCICGGGQFAGSGSCVYGVGGRVSRNPFERGTEYAGDAEISWLVQLGCILYGDQ